MCMCVCVLIKWKQAKNGKGREGRCSQPGELVSREGSGGEGRTEPACLEQIMNGL